MSDYNIKKLYEDMEMELITSMQRNLSGHLREESEVGFKFTQWQAAKLKELKRYQRENAKIIGGYTKGLNKKISDHLQSELVKGSKNAIKEYNKYNDDKKKINKTLNKSFFRTNDKKVNQLIKVVNNDLNKANIGALRMTNDEYREIIHKSAFFNANGIMTEKQATGMAVNELTDTKRIAMESVDKASESFLAGGLNCIEYSNGRRVNIASYADMAVRTASARAQLMGEGDFRKSIGRTLVQVSSHGGCCEMCAKWEGAILIDDVYSGGSKEDGNYPLLSEAMADGLFHPNCRHGIMTYYPELEEEEETPEEVVEDTQNRLNYYDRQEKRFNRLEKGSIDPNNKKEYKQKKLACQMKKDILVAEQEMPYEDITEEILKHAIPNDNEIPEIARYLEYNSRNANFSKNDITDVERTTLKKIQNKIGGQFKIIHKVNVDNVRTPDAEYTNKLLHKSKQYYDVKAPNQSETLKSKKTKISRQLDYAKGQTENVIISLLREECDLTNLEAVHQITECLNNDRYSWVNNVILVGKNDYLKIYKRK